MEKTKCPLAFLKSLLILSFAPCRSAAGFVFLGETTDNTRHADTGKNQKFRRKK
jgi:hypothetical protein